MFHKNAANVVRNVFPLVPGSSAESVFDLPNASRNPVETPRLTLVDARSHSSRALKAQSTNRTHAELFSIAARRCSAFFAEAAVLVLVFGILDFFMLKGKIELGWVGGAFAISLALLAASIGTDFSARRWLGAQP